MHKLTCLITCLIVTLFASSAIAQDELRTAEAKDTKRDTKTFNVTSLNGKAIKVRVIPDYVNRVLRMTCLKDTVSIPDFWGVPPDIEMLNKKFIRISYAVRGGSNLGLGKTLILCVNNNKLVEAMHVLKYTNWDSGDEKMDYHISLILNGSNNTNYQLTVSIHDYVYSKRNPETSYSYSDKTILSFDQSKNVFYSIKENVYNHVAVTKESKSTTVKVNGNYPVIILGKETYYYINNRWYQTVEDKEMSEI